MGVVAFVVVVVVFFAVVAAGVLLLLSSSSSSLLLLFCLLSNPRLMLCIYFECSKSYHRAVYADADIVLMDDPLSAVDAQVARQLFEGCIGRNGIFARRNPRCTRVLVTHQVSCSTLHPNSLFKKELVPARAVFA